MTTTTGEAAWRVELPVFEGPLDLLLYLVRRHELDILDIPIAFITAKYLEHLDWMRRLHLDVAAEYLLMAATLAWIKSRELLPTPEVGGEEDEEEQGDPRAELIRRLLEYQRYKEAADRLAERPLLGRDVFARGAAIPDDDGGEAPLAEVGVYALLAALGDIVKRARVRLGHDVVVDRVSVVQRIHEIAERIERERSCTLESCVDLAAASGEAELRDRIIATFLALLEMARLGLIRLHQVEGGGTIYVSRAAGEMRAADLATEYR